MTGGSSLSARAQGIAGAVLWDDGSTMIPQIYAQIAGLTIRRRSCDAAVNQHRRLERPTSATRAADQLQHRLSRSSRAAPLASEGQATAACRRIRKRRRNAADRSPGRGQRCSRAVASSRDNEPSQQGRRGELETDCGSLAMALEPWPAAV